MKYESYKKFFSGGFFPVDSLHKLVNLEDTGEFTVKATLGSGADTKVVNHCLPSVQGLTNMLNNYTGGSRYEALTSHSHHFIPEMYDMTSVAGVQKTIVNYFEQRKKPIIIKLDKDVVDISVKFNAVHTDAVIDFGDGTVRKYSQNKDYEFDYSYTEVKPHTVKIWSDNGGIQIYTSDNGYITSVESSIYRNYFTQIDGVGYAYFGVKKINNPAWWLNTDVNNTETHFDNTTTLQFGDGFTNFNTGIADWCNLNDYAATVTTFNLYCRNLYFDWSNIQFTKPLSINIQPDELTVKTASDYFARQTYTTKPVLTILKGIGQETWYQYCVDNYSDKFSSISKEE